MTTELRYAANELINAASAFLYVETSNPTERLRLMRLEKALIVIRQALEKDGDIQIPNYWITSKEVMGPKILGTEYKVWREEPPLSLLKEGDTVVRCFALD